MGKPARVIYWFRTDLRLHDSPALKAALDLDPDCLWPIFTWDPHYVYRAKGGTNRWQFLRAAGPVPPDAVPLDCQNDLSSSITRLNKKSKLFVLREAPQTLFPRLFGAWHVTHLVFEKDTDAYARERDDAVIRCAREAGVEVITRPGRTLWDSDEVVRANGGRPTMSIRQLQAAGRRVGDVAAPIGAPASLPDPGDMPVDELERGHDKPPSDPDPDYNARWRTLRDDKGYTRIAGPGGDFAIETMAELGLPAATTPHRGGEGEALRRLDEVVGDVGRAATFRKPLTSPAAFEPQSTTLLSPFLHFGALSCRLFYHRAQEAVDRYDREKKLEEGGSSSSSSSPSSSSPPESLTGQLLFRDMYFACQAALGHAMAQTMHNPQVRFVPWHLPSRMRVGDVGRRSAPTDDDADADGGSSIQTAVAGEYEVDSRRAEEWFQRWRSGATGFPWIDALMRQLAHDGWIHHLGRHSVACFLTRGGCYVHWERGADVFSDLLLDHEPACNSGNWQWLSCTAFFSQYYRCYSPVSFPQRWDGEGHFVRRWVPELDGLAPKYIYEPWKAPIADLRRAGVRLVDFPGVGKEMEHGTYPKPMFDFAERRRICIASLKKAYAVGLHGNDKQVLDGSWRKLFEGGGQDEEMTGPTHDSDDGADVDRAGSGSGDDEGNKQSTGKRVKGPMDRHLKKKKT